MIARIPQLTRLQSALRCSYAVKHSMLAFSLTPACSQFQATSLNFDSLNFVAMADAKKELFRFKLQSERSVDGFAN